MSENRLRDPWLIAAWPGMGAVALLAADHLVKTLRAEQVDDVAFDDWYDVHAVGVERGLFRAPTRPHHRLHAWRSPQRGGRDLLIFLAEAQPEGRGWAFCEALLDRVADHGPTRAVTFAALAAPHGPGHAAGVVVAASSRALLAELPPRAAMHLSDGEVGGLNGLLPAVAAERGLEGMCLLGEIPFFAANMPNPRAALAVVQAFSTLSGIPVDTEGLSMQAAQVDRRMEQLFQQLRDAAAEGRAQGELETPALELADTSPSEEPERLSAEDRRRVEALFEATARDRAHALELKSELDRLGIYREYEDRFLDLFKHAE